MRSSCWLLALGVVFGGACQAMPLALPCEQIPSGGCPVERGGTCSDLSCDALYACEEGDWRFHEQCSASPVGSSGGQAAADGSAGQGGDCLEIEVAAGVGRPSCQPDLQLPDCPLIALEACHPCATGCRDFFICTEDGWQPAAYCDEQEHVVLET